MLIAALSSLTLPCGLLGARAAEAENLTVQSVLSDLARATVTYVYVGLAALGLALGLTWVLGRRLAVAHQVSVTDPLTGLYNRRHFVASLASEMQHDRHRGLATCVLYLDLDRLKLINDNYGHDSGDAALVEVAKALTRGLRRRDVVARLGGDEFAVLLPDTAAEAAVQIGERILLDLSKRDAAFVSGLSVSIGVAELGVTASGSEVLAAADRALYCVKQTGGGRVSLAPPG